MNDIASTGKAVIIISSDLPELIGMSDRIYALKEGEITGVVDKKDASEETVMEYMLGVKRG